VPAIYGPSADDPGTSARLIKIKTGDVFELHL